MSDKKRERPDSEQLRKLACDLLSHDKVMERCVFGEYQSVLDDSDEFNELRVETLPLIELMGNLITIAGGFLYSKFNQWRSESGANPDDKEQPNALFLKRLLSGVQSTEEYFYKASSGLRVLRVLDGLYDSFDMNFLVIKYLIINSQIEAGFNSRKKGGLSTLIGFPHEDSFRFTCDPENKEFEKRGCNLAEAFNFIASYRNDPNLKGNEPVYKPYNIECDFEDVFKTMEFMKRVKLDIDSEGNVNFIENTADGKERYIPSFGVVKVFETKKGKCSGVYKSGMNLPKDFTVGFYLLEKIKYYLYPDTINAAIIFSYQSFDENDLAQVYFTEQDGPVPEDCKFEIIREKSAVDCFRKISGYLPGVRAASSFFRGMINAHYRYHNVLAPSIVDAIDKDREVKTRILNEFVKNNETLFKEALDSTFKTLEFALGETFPHEWKSKIDKLCDYILSDEYGSRRIIDWDTLLAKILIYEGPSEIIRTVLLHEKTTYTHNDKEQVDKICDQIIAGLEMRYIDNLFNTMEVSNTQKRKYDLLKLGIDKKNFPSDFVMKMECKARVQSYIDTIVSTLTKIDKKDNDTTNNKFAENSIQDTLEIIKTILANRKEKNSVNADKAFLRTITAFLSFYAGIFNSCHWRMNYEFEKSTTILSSEKTKEWQTKIEAEYFIGANKKAKELAKKFKAENAIEIALKELWNFAVMPSEDVKYYNAVLARAPINFAKLAKIFFVDKNDNIIFTGNEIVDFEQALDNGTLTEYLAKIIRFLAGDDTSDPKSSKEEIIDKSNYLGYKEHVKKVIYPQIVTYAKHREDSDDNDCLIMDHTGAFAEWHGGEVQILTEFKYTINNSYYVLPNLNRIETEWWVNPILISCYEFDKGVREATASADTK